MADSDKLLNVLGDLDSKVDHMVKSSAADKAVAEKGITELKTEVASLRKQHQELAEIANRRMIPQEREIYTGFGKQIQDIVRGKQAGEGTDADGGYLVFDEYVRMIKSVQNQYGAVRRIMGGDIWPMASDVAKIPVDTIETSGNMPVPLATSENAAITESDTAQLDQVTLTAQKYATLNKISNELLQDAFLPYIGEYLMPKIARQFAKKEDEVVFTAASTGVLNSTNMRILDMDAGNNTFSDVTFDDLVNMQDEVVNDALVNGKYLMHRSVLNIVRKLKGTDGHYIWAPISAGEPSTIDGYPYERVEVFPAKSTASQAEKGFIVFGDLSLDIVVGERGTRSMFLSDHRYMEYDQVGLRVIERFAYNTNANLGYALCVLKTAA